MSAIGTWGEFQRVGSPGSYPDRTECRAKGKSRLFVLVAHDEHAIARIKQLALTCIEIECSAGENDPASLSLRSAAMGATLRGHLTHRQFEIALSVARGLSNKDIGRELGISHFTVRNHLSQILLILGVSNRQELGELLRARSTWGDYTKVARLHAKGERIPNITRQAGN